MNITCCGSHVLEEQVSAAGDPRLIAIFSPLRLTSPRARRRSSRRPAGMRVVPGPTVIQLVFHDVEEPQRHRQAPGTDHVASAIAFVEASSPIELIVMCAAGLSRSPAIALAIATRFSDDPWRECEALAAAGPHVRPNRLVLEMADRFLELDGELERAAAATFPGGKRGEWGAIGPRGPAASWEVHTPWSAVL